MQRGSARLVRMGELAGGASREIAEVAAEMCLVVVARFERELSEGQRVAGAQAVGDSAEAQDARHRLRRDSDVLAEERGEVAPAPARLARDVLHTRRRIVEALPRPLEVAS